MKKSGIINPELCEALASLGHFDSFVNVGGKSIVGKGRPTQQEAFFVGGGRSAFNRLANSF